MIKDFERWPKYKELYIKAFAKMIERHPGEIKVLDPTQDTKFKLDFDGIEGGRVVPTLGTTQLTDATPAPSAEQIGGCSKDGWRWARSEDAKWLIEEWAKVGCYEVFHRWQSNKYARFIDELHREDEWK